MYFLTHLIKKAQQRFDTDAVGGKGGDTPRMTGFRDGNPRCVKSVPQDIARNGPP
ncbi:hypothetical protein J2Y66_001902 [Paenarthrobacter nitroguajacolicus]|nr:hypothetical protein [Paenarthrobacter nitroguajacolicus]